MSDQPAIGVVRRPMVGVALALVAGMVFACCVRVDAGWMLLAAFLCLLFACMFFRFRTSTHLVFLVVALVAACRFLVADPGLSAASVIHLRESLPVGDARIVGRISGFPDFRSYGDRRQGTWTFPLRCEGIDLGNGWERRRGVVDVRLTGTVDSCPVALGQRILLGGELRTRLFPGRNLVEMQVGSRDSVEVLDGRRGISIKVLGRAWRDAVVVRLEKGIESFPAQQAVFKALVLGDQSGLTAEMLDPYRRTGALHIFAISGLHVGMVGLLLAIVLKAVGVPRNRFALWLIPLLGMYVVSTGMKSSALRALAMAAVFLMGPLLRRKPDIPSSVAFAAVALLLFQPFELLSAGCVFSFVVVISIVMVYAAVPATWLEGNLAKRYLLSLAITSFAASLASIPLTALFFGRFSGISLVGNLVVVPLTFLVVLSGWLSIMVPGLSSVLNHAAVAFIDLMTFSVARLDALPWSSHAVEPPPLAAVCLWFASLVYLFTHRDRRIALPRALAGAGFAVLWCLVA